MLEVSHCRLTPDIPPILINTDDYPGTAFVNEEPGDQKSVRFNLCLSSVPSIDSAPKPLLKIRSSKGTGFSAAYRKFKREVNLAELALDPDELFAGTRDKTQGRDIRL